MHVLLVYAHPEPVSFNAALRDATVETLKKQGHDVVVSDLYAMRFDPIFKKEDFLARQNLEVFRPYPEALRACETKTFAPDISAEMEKVRRADLIIFQYPIWFSSMPAILKGWIDRVFQAGFAFTYTNMYTGGLLHGKKGLLIVTVGSPEFVYSKQGPHGDLRELLLPFSHATCESVGLEMLPPALILGCGGMTKEQGLAEIETLKQKLKAL